MVIYFHETHFGKNSQGAEAQPPWIQYWTGETLMNRMKQERTMKAGLIRTAMLVDERREKSKKNGKKGLSSTSEPEYVDSSHESESEYEADSEQTTSQVVVQRHRRRVIYSSESNDGHTIAQVVSLANKKKKVLQEKGSKSKRPKKVNVVPRVDSANANLGDNESNAASGNLREENDEPHQSPPQEEEPPHHQPPPQEEEPPHHEPQPQQQQHQPSNQSCNLIIIQHELIDISSGSEAEPEPTEVEPEPIPIRIYVANCVHRPVLPTQEVIDLASASNDEAQQQPKPIKMQVPKNEEEDKLITEVLISMADDGVLDPEPQTQPDPSAPSFSLNLGFPTPPITEAQSPATLDDEFPLTARTMAVINNMDELVSAPEPTTATPQPTKAIEDDFDDRAIRYQFMSMEPKSYINIGVVGLMCHVLNGEEGDRYEKLVYCLPPDLLLWMFFTYHHNWMDKKKRRPHEINSLTNHDEYLKYIDREKLSSRRFNIGGCMFLIKMFRKCLFWIQRTYRPQQTREQPSTKFGSNIMNQLLKWAGAPSILKKGSWSLPARYINIPQQPNNHDCAVFVMKWMELIDPTKLAGCCTYDIEQWTEPMLNEFRKKIVTKIIMSKENSMRADAIAAVQNMRVVSLGASLRSPFVPFSTPDLPTN
ncbi:hypothetical protein PIB30_001505 [Stylosanthes scabra]|uniref:Ubiquitin-like protease family profile domain-containing protein n=1 Tax=Stylosanthes scabra TaxID=79078 RepID=A0ABU6R305_9FABA|nr:hypothetical protein [Stylosanthes scabra]